MTKANFQLLFGLKHGITWHIIIKLFLWLQLLQFANAQYGSGPPSPNQTSLKPNFNPSMAIIMVVLVSAFFLLGFFSVYIRQCADRRFRGEGYGFGDSPIGGNGRRSRAARGLEAEVIETFPTFTYASVKGLKIGKGSLECAVCLNEFEDDETLRLLPRCNHVFHPDCIDAWLSSHTTCPVCRANLEPKPGEILTAPIRIFDPEPELNEPDVRPGSNESPTGVLVQSPPDVNLPTANQNHPRRTRSTGFRIPGIFLRSHTTGHSLVQVGENFDRFTLRLPEEVRNHILSSTRSLNRTKSCVAFPRVMSTRRGFRSRSSGLGGKISIYERFDHENRSGRRGFSMTPPFFSRTDSVRSPNIGGAGEEVMGTHKSLFRSVKSPFDRLFLGEVDRDNRNANNNVGEKSSDRLRLDSQV